MAISSKELANILNISPSTVSMVFNNKPGISEKTRNTVLDAAKKHGYDFTKKKDNKPSYGSIFLIIYKKHGAVVGDTPFFSQVTEGVESACRKNGFMLQIRYFYENEDTAAQIQDLNSGGCLGFLLLATEMNEQDFEPFYSLKAPIVVMDCYYDKLPYDTVLINNVQGAYIATDYLISQNHSKIGYLHSSISIGNFSERADGYYKALRHHHISTSHPYVFSVRPTTEGALEDMQAYIKEKREMPTCFFADNDIIAAACMRALIGSGYSVPGDISIVGFDNIPVCELISPPLTTMNVPKQDLGLMAVERLINRSKNSYDHLTKLELSAQLIIRESVVRFDDADI